MGFSLCDVSGTLEAGSMLGERRGSDKDRVLALADHCWPDELTTKRTKRTRNCGIKFGTNDNGRSAESEA
jgi:hypothetical protein